MIFDGGELARAWQAVAVASSDDKERPQLYRTVLMEAFPTGLRLVATDSFILLRTWVPTLEESGAAEPMIDEAPSATAVAMDPDRRAQGLFGYLHKLAKAAYRDDEPAPEVHLRMGVVAEEDADNPSFAGLETRHVTFAYEAQERLRLRTYEGSYPTWRNLVADEHIEETKAIALNTELLARLAKLRTWFPAQPLLWRFGGADRVAHVELEASWPLIEGLVMPVRSVEAEKANAKPDLVSEVFWQLVDQLDPKTQTDDDEDGAAS